MPGQATKRGRNAPRMAPEQRREQILDSALRLVLRDGYGAATMQAIAREAGVTRPVVYEFYPDRDELLHELIGREAEKALSVAVGLMPAVVAGRDLEALIGQALSSFLGVVAESPDTWRLILMPPAEAPEALRAFLHTGRVAVLEQIRTNFSLLPPPLGGRDADAELLAVVALAGSEAAARAMLADPERFPAQRLSAAVTWVMDQVEIEWSA
ncbi:MULTISPECIES: TetR/AcrR family transcriptional regulator [unclassified Nocardia]|uniref:TetR/AcrR family transcriptional regulator n=1 Tax=unclassified Nocardia TaxID=2637762 RepID=UPI0033B99605